MTARSTGTTGRTADGGAPAGFAPPPYPYERLNGAKAAATARFEGRGGLVDCSIGTPCDPPPPEVLEAMATSDAERGYPTSPGSPEYRRAADDWMRRRFGVVVDPERAVAACVGTKEFVATTAQFLHLRRPDRDTVLYPSVSYPTYAMGATLAGIRSVAVPELPGGGLDLDAVDPADIDRALLLWTNSPANPTGHLTDLARAAAWGRVHGVPVFSDECYAEFTWEGPPRTILESGGDGVVAVHSLSKRSNLAGVRAGFYAGDPDLVTYLLDVRRHAGLMVPGPVQAGAVVALEDDSHVDRQRAAYRDRLAFLADALALAGLPVAQPAGGFYLWLPVPDRFSDGWDLCDWLAREAGLLVSPGELYGPEGSGHVRVAVVQPLDRLEQVAERLGSVG